jgi:hypothetical protein
MGEIPSIDIALGVPEDCSDYTCNQEDANDGGNDDEQVEH